MRYWFEVPCIDYRVWPVPPYVRFLISHYYIVRKNGLSKETMRKAREKRRKTKKSLERSPGKKHRRLRFPYNVARKHRSMGSDQISLDQVD